MAGQGVELCAQTRRTGRCTGRCVGRTDHGSHFLGQHVIAERNPGVGLAQTMGGTSHQRLELAGVIVVHEQLLGQRGLVVQHVDQKAQRAQVVAELVESSGGTGLLLVDLVDQHFLDGFAHPQHGLRGLVQPQHRQHATHLRQVLRCIAQRTLVQRIAKEVVQQLLEFAERHAQFADHAAHGLAIADAAVQLLHPGLERLGLAALADTVQPRGQTRGAGRQLHIGRIEVFECGLEIEDGGGDFHRQLGAGWPCRPHHRLDGCPERLGQWSAGRMQLDQRIGHQIELLTDRFDLVGVAARKCRPGFLGGADALARLCQQQGIETAEMADLVVDGLEAGQGPCQADGRQRRRVRGARGNGLGTKEHQVLRQPVGDRQFTLGQRSVLHQDARSRPLDVKVDRQQSLCKRLEIATCDLPEDAWLARRL